MLFIACLQASLRIFSNFFQQKCSVIIIHGLRRIVKRNIRISALFRQSALFVIGIRGPRRENVIDVGAGLGDGFAVLGEQIFKPDRRIRILLICGGQRKVGI